MKTKIHFLSFFVLLGICSFAQSQVSNKLQKKAIFIIIDGISADQLEKAPTVYLDSIANEGNYSDAYVGGDKDTYTETPTISAVGYNSLLTGTWVNKHNVYGNSIKDPNYNYPSIFRLYKNSHPEGTIGVFSSWLDNRTKLVGDGLSATKNIGVDYYFDGLEYDTITYPHDKKRNFMKLIDYQVANKTVEMILHQAPDLSWVYLESSDDMGHMYGDSENFQATIKFEDLLVGKIWKAIKEREKTNAEDWLLIITTDHGRSQEDGKGHGGQTERERSTWIITNTSNINNYFEKEVPAIVDIAPTIASFLNVNVPKDVSYEWDGVSLIDPVSAIHLKAKKENKNLILSWKSLTEGKGEILLSSTNNFKTGGKDNYQPLVKIDLKKESIKIPLKKLPKGFCKFVLKTPNNSINTWFINN